MDSMQIRTRYFALSMIAAMVAGGVTTGGLMMWALPSNLNKVSEVLTILQREHYLPIDREKAIEGAIGGLVKAVGDPYTDYMEPVETQAFDHAVSATFEGIGAEIREENGQILVVSPIKGSPSEKAGVKPGDVILAVNGTKLSGMSATEAVRYIRGPKGSKALVQIRRAGFSAPVELSLIRDTIPVETVHASMAKDGAGIIQIVRFSERTAGEFESALSGLKAQGAKGIILDLRQNPGGLLVAAHGIAEQLLPAEKVIFQEKYKDGSVEQYRSKGKASDLSVVVLIDKGSASAAELLAAALKESGGIPLIGETSFGKATVQTTTAFEDGSSLKYTVAEWLTPNGNQIHKKGIVPDVAVSLPAYADLPFPVVAREFRVGEQDAAAQIVQKMLTVLGHNPGREDGLIDEGTSRALLAFQTEQGLEATGTLTPATALRAVLQLQQKIRENDLQMAKAQEVLQGLTQKR